jgi:hypothetical protein
MLVEMAWLNSAGTEVTPRAQGSGVLVTDTSGWTRLTVTAVSPATADYATVRVRDTGITGWSAWRGGEYFDADAVMVTLGSEYPYFDGSTLDTTQYAYEWTGTVDASPSRRLTLEQDETDPLQDPDCDPVPPAPRPPTIDPACIIETGTWRRYMAVIPETEVILWGSTIPTLTLTTAAAAERQVRIRFYANPDGLAPSQVDMSYWEAELIITYIPKHTVLTLDRITRRVRASVNGGELRAANQLLYGTGGMPAVWPELRCGIGYIVTLDVPLDAPSGNLTTAIALTTRM